MSSILRKWGLGVELVFEAGRAAVNMTRTTQAVVRMREGFSNLGSKVTSTIESLGKVGAVLAPLGAAFGVAIGKGSQLAADLEAQRLTMRVMLGDAAKAEVLIASIRKEASATPFAEGDLIEGSKRLLRLSGKNVDANMELLRLVETMTALNPTKSITDSVEAVLDATSGGGFERLKEYGLAFRAEDFAKMGRPGGKAWADAVVAAIDAEMKAKTNGENIVGALSETFSGRMSTLQDAVSNILRSMGEVVNREVGPMFSPLTTALTDLEARATGAMSRLIGQVRRLAAVLAPTGRALGRWWEALGASGQERLLGAVLALGALAAVLVPLGGAVGAVSLAVSGLWGAVAGLGGIVASVLAPEVLLPIVGALLAIGGAVAGLYAVFARQGEGPLAFFSRLARTVGGYLATAFHSARIAWAVFSVGFRETFHGFDAAIVSLSPKIQQLADRVLDLVDYLVGGTLDPTIWLSIGQAIGWVADHALYSLVKGQKLVIAGFDIMFSLVQPFQAVLVTILQGLVNLITGTGTAREAFATMFRGILGLISAFIAAIFTIILGATELLLRALVTALSAIPGMQSILDSTGNLGADKLAAARADLATGIANDIFGVNLAETRRDREAGKASSPTVNVAPEVKADVNVQTAVKIDGNEVARATGAESVRAGRRQGRELPASQRGKVLRGGGVVTPLQPAEVL